MCLSDTKVTHSGIDWIAFLPYGLSANFSAGIMHCHIVWGLEVYAHTCKHPQRRAAMAILCWVELVGHKEVLSSRITEEDAAIVQSKAVDETWLYC